MSVQIQRMFRIIKRHNLNKSFSTSSSTSSKAQNRGKLVISSKRKDYNFYSNDHYSKLDEVPLVSKGWDHSKAKGDHFTIHPHAEEKQEMTPLTALDFQVHPRLVDCLRTEAGVETATRFQQEAFDAISKGNHILLAAETGCGKTIAYLVPIIQSLIGRGKDLLNSPAVIVMVPNRELAHQVGEVAAQLAKPFDLNVRVVVGGRTKKLMMNPEFTNIDVLVATPGALGKLSTVGVFNLKNVTHTILDEADTLLDDSFEERVGGILRRIPQSRIILVSATLPASLPGSLQPIESDLRNVISPNIHRPLSNVTQTFLRITRSVKPGFLLDVVRKNSSGSATGDKQMIVFTNKNETCNWLAMYLRENGVPCANINGDMNYAIRIQQWNDFLTGNARVLSATDVGSRGLNTTRIDHVLNYDFPLHAADYLHRIGRTGRFGSPESCSVTNFITGPLEIKLVQKIELSVRRRQALDHVDGNITKIVQNKIKRRMQEAV